MGTNQSEPYDSTADTLAHIENVQVFFIDLASNMVRRATVHDQSKLVDPEKSAYDQFTPLLRDLTYGSQPYKECLVQMGSALEHHYANNSHHPEHWPVPETPEIAHLEAIIQGMDEENPARPYLVKYCEELTSRLCNMSLLDIIEMLADWKAATLRHADGDILKSLVINQKRFQISSQLYQILQNTVKEMGW